MANYIRISSIRITSKTENKVLNETEIKKFCEKKVEISATCDLNDLDNNALNCRVVLNKMSKKYIESMLQKPINRKEEKQSVKPAPKVPSQKEHSIKAPPRKVRFVLSFLYSFIVFYFILPVWMISFLIYRLDQLKSYTKPKAKRNYN